MIFYVLSPRQSVLDAAVSVGANAVVVSDADTVAARQHAHQPIEVVDPLDPLEVARALEPLIDKGQDAVCVGLGDDSSQVAALVNSALGLAGGKYSSFSSLEVMRDKHRLRNVLAAGSGLNGLHWTMTLGDDPAADLRPLFAQVSHGIVVKPHSGSGSRGVHSIASEGELEALRLEPGSYVVEQRFVGPEFSVEGISWDGQYRLLVVTEKSTGGASGLVETGHRQPAQVDSQARDRLCTAAGEVLDHAGYRFGPSHIEFILEDGQPRLIEAHGRVGGDRIADLMAWSVGASIFEALFSSYVHEGLPSLHESGGQAAVIFPDLRSWPHGDEQWLRQVREHAGVEEAGILKEDGTRGDINCSADRHAYVIVSGSKVDESIDFLQRHNLIS